ncbi:hypothetical protein BE221DRAFT_63255 [Ostreococcus tauri]|uniref:WW domain-containing protein n=1 Tax=Ostreococcus tauri TaxID=70448 RepID=A0A1Y5HYL3_OSTTA|nr:hypothetical protein BE221DRAFT_63255 [Ostreococcus tauri]
MDGVERMETTTTTDASPARSVASATSSRLLRMLGDDDDYDIVAEFRCAETGTLWVMREDARSGRRHYYDAKTNTREEKRRETWMLERRVVDEFAKDSDSDEKGRAAPRPRGWDDDARSDSDDGGEEEKFVSASTGHKYTRYRDEDRDAYYYFNHDTGETSWEHPDGDGAELLQFAGLGAVVAATAPVAAPVAAEAPRPEITREEYIEAKLQKMMLVEMKWMEKQPPVAAVPERPDGFEGVYGARDQFWDPDADTYSVDNNEGSERGDDAHADAHAAIDDLDRFTSAVDMATPEDMRPRNAAKAFLDDLLTRVYEKMEEEEDFAYAQTRANAKVAEYKKKGKIVGVRRLNVEELPEISSDFAFEKTRAEEAEKRVSARLAFNESAEARESGLAPRLIAPMDGHYTKRTTLIKFDSGHDAETLWNPRRSGYLGGSYRDDDKDDDKDGAGVSARPRERENINVDRGSAATDASDAGASPRRANADDDADDADGETTTTKPSGFFARMFAPASASVRRRKARRQLEREARELKASGYVAPWDA